MADTTPHELKPVAELAVTTPVLDAATIQQFEKSGQNMEKLYKQVFSSNEALALWLRRRAAALSPDIKDREAIVTIALELLSMADSQLLKNSLLKKWQKAGKSAPAK